MGYTVGVKLDTRLAGVTTSVTQVMDLSLLTPAQIKRLCNAAKRGVVSGQYGAEAMTLAFIAQQAGINPPIKVSKSGWRGPSVELPPGLPASVAQDFLRLMEVRYKMARAQQPPRDVGRYHNADWGKPTMEGTQIIKCGLDHIVSKGELAKLAEQHLVTPEIKEAGAQLAEVIATRPCYEVTQ